LDDSEQLTIPTVVFLGQFNGRRPVFRSKNHCNRHCRKMEKRRMEKRSRSNINQQYMTVAQS
jgi:hypothetical protein